MFYLSFLVTLLVFGPRAGIAPAGAQVTPEQAEHALGPDWGSKCVIRPPARGVDPDLYAGQGDLISNTIETFSDVVSHDGKKSNAGRNEGIASYMGHSLMASDKLFNAAFAFYSRIKERDSSDPKLMCGIQEVSSYDALAWAQEAAHGDAYLALKILAIYGHDNLQTQLAVDGQTGSLDCRLRVLDTVRPKLDSSLYCNGAMPATRYARADVDRGREIAAQCNGPTLTELEKRLCNDGLPSYQADYYHVIASSFLGCRQVIEEKMASEATLKTSAVGFVTQQAYPELARSYKLDRFKEEVATLRASTEPEAKFLRPLLELALARIGSGTKPALPDYGWYKYRMLADPDYPTIGDTRLYEAARAIAARYEFEVGFRASQHRMGFNNGRALCKDTKTFISRCP